MLEILFRNQDFAAVSKPAGIAGRGGGQPAGNGGGAVKRSPPLADAPFGQADQRCAAACFERSGGI